MSPPPRLQVRPNPEPHPSGPPVGADRGARPSRRLWTWLGALALAWASAIQLLSAPEPLPSWSMELVAAAPDIRHPSVVCVAPNGRVYVAEDPMDISEPAHAPLGRILCFHPDGRRTVFAEGLYAVFGLQYLEGHLYVLHNPKFSRFRDDQGVGRDRLDLIESTNPNPWALEWNDHVPANFRLGMDGYFYVAVGDKGLFGAVGRDGSRVDLRGGGIVRLRPDGTELEVFSTGVRNILDVALNDEDELFTYDNTDEQQWMGRVTHMVDGGFYGYPYDFIPQQPYTLWMMVDYGAGAATGVLCYQDDVLPREYAGNLFLADFGKRQVMRVQVERAGGSYRAVTRQDLFPDPPSDFRPVGLAWGVDRASIYVCDWQHRDTKAEVSVGRLWRLRYRQPQPGTPWPAWYVSAAAGEPQAPDLAAWLGGLRHPSHAVRLAAQRQLLRHGAAAVPPLVQTLADRAQPEPARWHALWALDGWTNHPTAILALDQALQDPLPSVRRQALRQAGNRRRLAAEPVVRAQLADPNPSVRFSAATALGRLGLTNAVPALMAQLADEDLFARYATFTALHRIARRAEEVWPLMVPALDHPQPRIREGVQWAARETYQTGLVTALVAHLDQSERSPSSRAEALRLLSALHRKTPAWQGEWWAYHPVNKPPPAKTVEWSETATILRAVAAGLNATEPALRDAALDAVISTRHTNAARTLIASVERESDPAVQAKMVRALSLVRDDPSAQVVAVLLSNPTTPPPVRLAAIASAQELGGATSIAALRQCLSTAAGHEAWLIPLVQALGNLRAAAALEALAARLPTAGDDLRAALFDALVRIGGDPAARALQHHFQSVSPALREGAIAAAGRLKHPALLEPLLVQAKDSAVAAAASLALAQSPHLRALEIYVQGLTNKTTSVREACRRAIRSLGLPALDALEPTLAGLDSSAIGELRAAFADEPKARSGLLYSAALRTLDSDDYRRFAAHTQGDAGRGRALFHNLGGVACVQCHIVHGVGGRIGPDLSGIGAQFGREDLIESVLAPSKVIREGYQQVLVETQDDETYSGLVRWETGAELGLMTTDGKTHAIAKSSIRSRRTTDLSLMPEGLERALTLAEFADLLAYLQSLRPAQ